MEYAYTGRERVKNEKRKEEIEGKTGKKTSCKKEKKKKKG